jgi:hypothetical protein
MMNLNLHKRRSIRLQDYNYSQPGEYIITISTYNYGCLFGKNVGEEMRLNTLGKIVHEELLRTAEIYGDVELDVYKNKTPRKARQYPQASGCLIIFMGLSY